MHTREGSLTLLASCSLTVHPYAKLNVTNLTPHGSFASQHIRGPLPTVAD